MNMKKQRSLEAILEASYHRYEEKTDRIGPCPQKNLKPALEVTEKPTVQTLVLESVRTDSIS